ncbi:MAG TPA: NUDIX domain-containing protein [Humisphaera sp.]
MPRDPIPTWFSALTVVRRPADGRFLLVQESSHGTRWYVPAGRVEAGETLAAAAVRETLEEGGIRVRLTGVLRIEHTPRPEGARVRAVFLAEPADDAPPKSVPDAESLQARWVTPGELGGYDLRGADVVPLFDHVAGGGAVFPLSVLGLEGEAVGAGGGGGGGVGRPAGTWCVRRVDDNGNAFVVQGGLGRDNAERAAAAFEARGHKQTYWAEPERG